MLDRELTVRRLEDAGASTSATMQSREARMRSMVWLVLALGLFACKGEEDDSGAVVYVTPPMVAETSPPAGAALVPVDTAVVVTFTEDLDPETTTDAIGLATSGGDPVAGATTHSGDVLTFTPDADLDWDTTYTATVAGTVANLDHDAMGDDVTFSFTTTAAPLYTVGGSVTGLHGTVLLQLLGGHDLPIVSDGPFTFPALLSDGASFAVSVAAHPDRQACEVAEGTGTIAGADITSVAVTCSDPAWHLPAALTDAVSPAGVSIEEVRVAVSDADDAIVATKSWSYTNDCSSVPCGRLFVSERTEGVWVHPADETDYISLPDTNIYQFAVDMNASGDVILAWTQADANGDDQVYMSERTGGVWTHPSALGDHINPPGEDAWGLDVAIADNGDAVVLWGQRLGDPGSQPFLSERRAGIWTHPDDLEDGISPHTDSSLYDLVVDMGADGETLVVWRQHAVAGHGWFRSLYLDGQWHHPASTDDAWVVRGIIGLSLDAAMNDAGHAMVVWRESDESDECNSSACARLYFSEWDGVSWQDPELGMEISPPGVWSSPPQVVLTDAGDALALTDAQGQTTDCNGSPCHHLWLSERWGGAWNVPADATDPFTPLGTDVDYGTPLLAVDAAGTSVVGWYTYDGGTSCTDCMGGRRSGCACRELYLAERRGGTWAFPADLTDHPTLEGSSVGAAAVALSNSGYGLLAWSQGDVTTDCDGNDCGRLYIGEFR